MKIQRTGSAQWLGSGKDGKGTVSTPSTVLNQTQYSFNSRFKEGIGTNPEELLGAAHAGCYSMKLAFNLQGAGFVAESIDTTAKVILQDGTITDVELETKVKAAGLEEEQFLELAKDAELNCPVSKLFNAKITLKAELV